MEVDGTDRESSLGSESDIAGAQELPHTHSSPPILTPDDDHPRGGSILRNRRAQANNEGMNKDPLLTTPTTVSSASSLNEQISVLADIRDNGRPEPVVSSWETIRKCVTWFYTGWVITEAVTIDLINPCFAPGQITQAMLDELSYPPAFLRNLWFFWGQTDTLLVANTPWMWWFCLQAVIILMPLCVINVVLELKKSPKTAFIGLLSHGMVAVTLLPIYATYMFDERYSLSLVGYMVYLGYTAFVLIGTLDYAQKQLPWHLSFLPLNKRPYDWFLIFVLSFFFMCAVYFPMVNVLAPTGTITEESLKGLSFPPVFARKLYLQWSENFEPFIRVNEIWFASMQGSISFLLAPLSMVIAYGLIYPFRALPKITFFFCGWYLGLLGTYTTQSLFFGIKRPFTAVIYLIPLVFNILLLHRMYMMVFSDQDTKRRPRNEGSELTTDMKTPTPSEIAADAQNGPTIYLKPTPEQWFWYRIFKWIFSPENPSWLHRQLLGALVTPSTNFNFLNLHFQYYLYMLFHQTFGGRMNHFMTMPVNMFFINVMLCYFPILIEQSSQERTIYLTELNGSLVWTLLCMFWYTLLGFYSNVNLLGPLMILPMAVTHIAATVYYNVFRELDPEKASFWNPTYSLFSNPVIWFVIWSFLQSMGHAFEPNLPPRMNGTDHWMRWEDFVYRTHVPRIRTYVKVFFQAVFFGPFDEMLATPRFMPIQVMKVAYMLGYQPARLKKVYHLVDVVVSLADPALDYIGTGGGAYLGDANQRKRTFIRRTRERAAAFYREVPQEPEFEEDGFDDSSAMDIATVLRQDGEKYLKEVANVHHVDMGEASVQSNMDDEEEQTEVENN